MYKWPLSTDVFSCWKPYLCFVAYLAFLSITPGFSYTTVGGQGGELFAYNRCYLYLQFIACFFVVGTTANLFEETFRTTSRQYIRTLPLGTCDLGAVHQTASVHPHPLCAHSAVHIYLRQRQFARLLSAVSYILRFISLLSLALIKDGSLIWQRYYYVLWVLII